MELFQVRYFLALARTLNFTRAAETCNVSQPALTRAIQRLEEELGGPLLYRERSLTQLTALGRAMLPHLEAANSAAETAAAQASAFRKGDSAPLQLGIDISLSAAVLAPVLRELQGRLPGFELGLVSGSTPELVGRLMEGELHGAVLVDGERQPERLDRWRLFQDRYVVLCPTGHRLAGLKAIPVEALAEEPIVSRLDPASEFEQALSRLGAAKGVTMRIRHRCSGEDQIDPLVAAGLGIALAAEHRRPAPGVVARPLDDPSADREIVVAAVAGRQHGPSLAAFLTLMRARDWSNAQPE